MNNEFFNLRSGATILLEKQATATTETTGETKEETKKEETSSGGFKALLPMLLMYAVIILALYFIMIRPQRKKSKEEKKMRENLQVGDEVVTIGGIYGRVVSLKEDTMVIESKSDHSKLTIARWALQQDLTVHEETEK